MKEDGCMAKPGYVHYTKLHFRLTTISQNLKNTSKILAWALQTKLWTFASLHVHVLLQIFAVLQHWLYLHNGNIRIHHICIYPFVVHAFVCCSGQLERWVQEHVISMHILVSHKHKVTFLEIASRFWWNIHLFCTGCIIWPGPYPQHRCYQCCWFSNRQHLKTSSTW